ncbi:MULTISPECIES: FkbM family methyltransferase [Methylobacterium]|jgi:FkbM family methyltransferase|uniref:FkbM family methyltransferase n=3 Tax=Methylobacteriaceae TaxID=119045 RepID=UPI0008E53A4D|nr:MULTISPECIES: FkbM family methyltransferase [Methylobacterium]MBK3395987.1 FkbM family methyltransferase [Methylobacterium ajmalii]MBK3409720.1 FkbM family methyltransferase [Methylobacterium ajmalii]MBK3422463.1 FkbM family methyltransferase [Methylobacterium ajmalii]SFF37167.1 methyltransferase, FkbM family [Methylobacterium sp. yr596]
MTPSGQTLCLAMIVKNEAPVIRRCLDSVRPLIDRWIVVDTGSTDGTQGLVREILADLPGELVERPWVDFAHNRSEALALARPHGTYTLVIDADDEMIVPPGYVLPDLTADAYEVVIADVGLVYRRIQLVRNTLPWRYRGVLHEFVECPDGTDRALLDLTMRRNHDGARRRDGETYRRDAAVLEAALATETDPFFVSRYTFYLAQSYRDCGAYEQAVAAYLRRADLGYWHEEAYVALVAAARLMGTLGRPLDEALAAFRRAIALCPHRAEAAHHAAYACRLAERYEEGFRFAEAALALGKPEGGLFVEPWVYEYGLRDEYAVNAYWAGHYRQCLAACLDLLACPTAPEGERKRYAANARFALEKLPIPSEGRGGFLASTRPGIAPSELPGFWSGLTRHQPWVPARPQGGTELMHEGLSRRLGPALQRIQLCLNGYDEGRIDGRPLVVWIHHAPDQPAVAWLRDPAKVGRVARFVFVSEWQRAQFLAAFALPAERCLVLRNATEVPDRARAPGRRRPLKVAYTSTPYRGLSVLLEAWAQAAPEGAELHVWSSHKLYGPGADDAPYAALYARAAALPNVHYHGLLPNAELRAALADIDILAYPNTFAETSCLAVIEAMAAGCRVICPSLGALPETTAGFARLYPFAADPAEHARTFAALLTEELADPWQGAPERAAAQQAQCRQAYDWRVRVPAWQALVDGLAAPAPSPRFVPSLRTVEARHGTFVVVEQDFIGRTIAQTGEWEPHLIDFARLVLDETSNVVDLGANLGYHTVRLAGLVPRGSVHAFEPLDLCFSLLQRNVLANRCHHVRTYKMAVTDRSGDTIEMEPLEATLTAGGALNIGHTGIGRAGSGHGGDLAFTVRIDDLPLPPIALVKMDIQGAEAVALAGMRDLLARDRPVLFVEIEEEHLRRHGSSSKAVIEHLLGLGYSLLRIRNEWPTDHLAIPNERTDLIERCRGQTHHATDWIAGSRVELQFETTHYYASVVAS